MSISNLLQENNYNIFANEITANVLDIGDLEVDNLTIKTGANPAVELSTTAGGALQVSNNIFTTGIQFGAPSSPQDVLNNYFFESNTSQYLFTSPGIDTGVLDIRLLRMGNIVFCEVSGVMNYADDLASTTAIPVNYRPSNDVQVVLPLFNSANAIKGFQYLGILQTDGILIFKNALNDNNTATPSVFYYIGNNDTDTQRYTFCYRI